MWRRIALLLVSVSPLACSWLFAISDDAASGARDGGDVDAASDVANASSDDALGEAGLPPLRCAQTGRGPVLVPAGDRFCIDNTPVTSAEYAAFLDAGVGLDTQIPGCAGNTSFAPKVEAADADYPVHAVDWCDAYAFCAWAGKRLCGAFPGEDGGVSDEASASEGGVSHGLEFGEVPTRSVSTWAYACQGGDAALTYPYGNDLDPDACAPGPGGFSPSTMFPVPLPTCHGGFPGVFDMIDDVREWVDACRNGACAAAGAPDCRHYETTLGTVDVTFYSYVGPIGFRCCSVAAPTR